MKILTEKEGGFYNNKLLVFSVVVLMILAMAVIVYATINKGTSTPVYPTDNIVIWSSSTLTDFNCTINTESGVSSGNISIWTNASGSWLPNASGTWSGTGIKNVSVNLSTFPDKMAIVWNCNITQDGAGDDEGNWTDTNFTLSLDTTAPTPFSLENATVSGSAVLNNTVVSGAINSYIVLNWSATTEAHFINYTVLVYNSTNYTDANLVAINKTTSTSSTDVNVTPLASVGTTFADGTYYWYVKAYENDSANRAERNSTEKVMQFVIDTGLTVATLNAPANDTWDSDGSVIFNYTVNDANVDTCIIYYNITGSPFIANQSNSSLIATDVVFSDPAVSLSDGNYTWKVWCNDTGGNKDNSTSWIIKVDNTNPTIDFAGGTASNYSFLNQNYIYVNVTASDTYESNITFYLYNSTLNLSSNTTYTDGTRNVNFTSLLQGLYFYNVTIRDEAGNLNSTLTRYITLDTTTPIVSISSLAEADNTYVDRNWVAFNVSITEANFSNVTYYLYNSTLDLLSNITNTTITENFVNFTSLSDGLYYYNATVIDRASLSASTETRNITVDTTVPTEPTLGNVLLGSLYYGNNTLGSDQTPTVNWTIVTETNFANYTIQFANVSTFGAENISNQTKVTARTTNTTTIGTGLLDNVTYYWRVIAYDLAGNSNTSGWYNYTTDFTNPVSKPNQPSSVTTTTYKTDANVTFNYTLTEVNPDTCALWGNFSGTWRQNQTNTSLGGELTNFSIASATLTLGNGTYIWNAYCNDSAITPNTAWANSTTNFTLVVDTSTPTITPVTTNGSTTKSRVIEFTVTPTANTAINQSSISVTPNASSSSNLNYTNDCTSDGSNGYNCSYIETGLTAGQVNILNISAKTNAGVSATIYNLYITPSAGYNFTLALASEWNLVSTPLILENNSWVNIMANNSKISSIYAFDGSSWTSWTSSAPCTSGSSCLTNLTPLQGYWIDTTAATNLYLFGNKTTGTPLRGYGMSYPRSLSASTWYLIGQYVSNFTGGYNTDDALSALCTTGLCSTTSTKFDALDWYDTTASELTPALKSNYDTDGLWTRGRGFWIYMNTAHTFQGTPP